MNSPNKVVVITGASQGIGAGLVQAYRDRGARVVANSRSIRKSDDANVLTVPGDIADPKIAERVISEAFDRFGRIDTLINNAGIFSAKPFTEFTSDDFETTLHTNLAGFFFVTQQAVRKMTAQGSGHIVQVTASIVDQPINGVPAMLASITKGGLNAATKGLAIEYASRGIRVNAVAPGVIKTPMHAPESHSALAGLHPIGRMGEIHEIVDAVVFLDDSSFVTGEILHVAGGQSAGHW
jgi:NAD(P)-dependent dehydrogenase (short-subunit alcohol dehydrogenase family)